MRQLSFLIVSLTSISSMIHATVVQDTTVVAQRDSVITTPSDTTRVRFIAGLGSLRALIDSTDALHSSQFVWTDAAYLGDLLLKIPGYYLQSLGEVGKLGQFSSFGLDGRSIPVLLDGRPINEPYSGVVNLYDVPLEAIEQIEIMDASDAVMYGSQGAGLNIVTRQYNNNRPITKLRYMQGPFEYGLTDGMFAQNILRGTNLTVGLQRHATDGRFTNSGYDSWNIRSRLRYNVSDRFNIAASYFYHSADNGQNGGIHDSSASFFDEVEAIVRDSTASESSSRHDFAVTGIARLLSDSASITQFSLFSMQSDREYTDSTKIQGSSSLIGGRVLQRLSASSFNAALGLDFIREKSSGYTWYEQGERSRSALFGKLELRPLDQFILAVSFRTEVHESGRGTLSYGLSLTSHISDHMSVWGNLSTFVPHQQSRTLQKLSVGIDLRVNNSTRLSVLGYIRSQQHPLPYSTFIGNSLTGWTVVSPMGGAIGGSALLSTTLWKLESTLTGTWTQFENENTDIVTPSFPILISTGELAYRDVILPDVMELRTGVRFRYTSPSRGVRYLPPYALYVLNIGERINESFTLDIFAVAHLGDAYLTLSWENILDEEYMTVSRYPMPGRTFRFGFNWTFFD